MDRFPCSILWLPNLRQGPCNCQEPCQALVNFHSPVMPHTLYMYEANFNFLKDRFYFVVLDIEKMYILKKKNLALFVSRCPPTAYLSPTSVGCPQPTCCPRTSACHLPPPTRGHSPPFMTLVLHLPRGVPKCLEALRQHLSPLHISPLHGEAKRTTDKRCSLK